MERNPAAAELEGAAQLADTGASDEVALAELLLALAQEDRAHDCWDMPATVIPPAPASLALIAAVREREALHTLPHIASLAIEPTTITLVQQPVPQPVPLAAVQVSRAAKPQPKRPVETPAEKLHQLSLF